MKAGHTFESGTTTRKSSASGLAATALLFGAVLAAGSVLAQDDIKSGEQVVASACASCHAGGKDGAPTIGDKKAWSARASAGLTVLTHAALTGIRRMPAHGGNPGLSDVEVQRAIIVMVNKSGGHWVEPTDASRPAPLRSGEQIVRLQCSKCHQDGAGGAPLIGDRAAWTPRLKNGLEATVRSAINGHGGMPARGGMANLQDAEVRSAVTYMFDPGGPAAPAK